MSKQVFSKVVMAAATIILATGCASSSKDEASNRPKTADQIAQERQAEADKAQQQAQLAEQNSQKAQDQVVMARMASDRDAYIQTAQKRMDSLTQRSDELHARAARANGPEKTHLDNVSSDFDGNLTEVRRNLEQAKTVEPRYWLDQKRALEKSINKAEATYDSTVTSMQ